MYTSINLIINEAYWFILTENVVKERNYSCTFPSIFYSKTLILTSLPNTNKKTIPSHNNTLWGLVLLGYFFDNKVSV